MTYMEQMTQLQNRTLSENGAMAYRSTSNALVDCFGMIGAMRNRNEEDIRRLYTKALIEHRNLAIHLAFYVRDVLEGLGERRTGRILFQVLAEKEQDVMRKNLHLINEYGRFDDYLSLLETPIQKEVVQYLKKTIEEDIFRMENKESISLLGKWLPSVNASSYQTRQQAKKLCALFNMTQKEYRHILAQLRSYSNVVETKMSRHAFDEIHYESVPSLAMLRYQNSFLHQDASRYTNYISDVMEGKKSIQSKTLYPYDIVRKVFHGAYSDTLEVQWNHLPRLDSQENILVMADVSGSMYGDPLYTAIGLAMYFAEQNKGIFHNRFLTFSMRPELVEIKGNTLLEKVEYIKDADWNMNTDLNAAFELILSSAIASHASQKELPERLVIISDMEIDACCSTDWSFLKTMKRKFQAHGYLLPQIVFWNVSARHNTFLCDGSEDGLILVSGASSKIFESICSGTFERPMEYIQALLEKDRYQRILL